MNVVVAGRVCTSSEVGDVIDGEDCVDCAGVCAIAGEASAVSKANVVTHDFIATPLYGGETKSDSDRSTYA